MLKLPKIIAKFCLLEGIYVNLSNRYGKRNFNQCFSIYIDVFSVKQN